jgi:type II pantothenate kinase
LDTTGVGEFDAWSAGARTLLREQGVAEGGPVLLVSLGTGTSVLRVEGERATRVGGTALGGGTLLGLGAVLTGRTRFEELVELAGAGDRNRVDLLVSDIYPQGLAELPGAASAASFGKLPRLASSGESPDPRDLAGALMALVGENVALLCNEIAGREQLRRLVFGGAALASNPPLARWLVALTRAFGREAVLLTHGAHTGAVGALVVAERDL